MDISFLDKFLQQTKTTNLKTKDLYPDLINDLDVKVSFGMGTPTHVPWISTLGPGMSTSNGYYPVYLYYKKENILILAYGISETVDYEEPWTREIVDSNQKIKDFLDKPFRYGESYVFQTYVPEITETEVKYFRNEREISKEDIAKDLKDITDKYKECLDIEVKDEGSDLSKGLFYMESQLEDFIIQNWNESEFGKKYDLIIKDGELESQQYRTDIGPIDILATDKNTGEYVVIELKRNQTSDQTIGQIARYMQWVEENLNKGVKGVIVCGINCESSIEAQLHTEDAVSVGADAIMVFPPFSWALSLSTKMAVLHHELISKVSDHPIFLYQASIGTGFMAYSPETLRELIQLPKVVAIKEGSWETSRYDANRRLIKKINPNISVMASGDEHLLSCFMIGSEGTLVSLATIIPAQIVGLDKAVKNSDLNLAMHFHEQIYPLAKAIYGTKPAGFATSRIKACLKIMGRLSNDTVRSPGHNLDQEEISKLRSILKDIKVL